MRIYISIYKHIYLYTRWVILIDPNISVGKSPTETWFGQKLSRTMGPSICTTHLDLQIFKVI